MHFANPAAFWLLPLLAVLLWLREFRSDRFMARLPFPDFAVLESMPSSRRARWVRLPAWLLYAGLTLAIVALARPQALLKGEEARARGIDMIIALDTSGSMRALDFNPLDRMAVAKRATRTFIAHRRHDRIGLVAFAGVSLLQCPLTLDYGALLDFLDQVGVGMTSTENTAIGTAIATAANRLKKSAAKSKAVILVTDGRSNSGEIDPLTAAQAARSLGIKIYAIGVGIRGPSVIPVDTAWGKQLAPIQEDLDEPGLEAISGATDGRYYRASSAKEFDAIYGEIDRLEKTEIHGPAPRSYEDRYLGWLIAAMALISAGAGLQASAFRTFP